MNNTVKIMLIEDDMSDAELVAEVLADQQTTRYEIVHKVCLEDGLRRLYESENEFAAVLLDLSLPDEDGLACIEKVRAQAPEVPVVVLTGREDEGYALQALQQGAQDYLFKRDLVSGALIRSLRYARERQQLMLDLGDMQDIVKDAVYSEQQAVATALKQPLNKASMRVEQLLARPAVNEAEREALEDIRQAMREITKWVGKLEIDHPSIS